MDDKTLYLHVGHGKTGSSFLQSVLWMNRDVLLAKGIYYPIEPGRKSFSESSITSGNGYLMAKSFSRFNSWSKRDKLVRNLSDSDLQALCYSSEFLFDSMVQDEFLHHLVEFCRTKGIERINVLLFIRNPIDHIVSTYQQSIKRRGGVRRLSDMPFTRYEVPKQVEGFLLKTQSLDIDVKASIFNYSYHKSGLFDILCDWLGVRSSDLSLPKATLVNRSLTSGELELQRLLNRKFGIDANFLSDRLCEFVPEAKKSVMLPPIEKQEEIIARLRGAIENVNRLVPNTEQYDIDIQPSQKLASADFVFTQAQLEAIVDAVADSLRLKHSLKSRAIRLLKSLPGLGHHF